MNTETVKKLCALTTSFYQNQAASFSQTRQTPWRGWKQCLKHLEDLLVRRSTTEQADKTVRDDLKILDLGSGNLRFERYLCEELPHASLTFFCVDNCAALLPRESTSCGDDEVSGDMHQIFHQDLDILATICHGTLLAGELSAPLCDVSVAFGFLHHVPKAEYRNAVLKALMQKTRSGGLIMVSLWQFLKNDDLKEKALKTHARALKEVGLPSLEKNDVLLSWDNIPGVFRYCHSFSDEEITQLAESFSDDATVLARFVSDGRTDDLNTYLIFQKR